MKRMIVPNEQGFIMVWALLLLVVVTLLGVAGVTTSIFEEKMAANQALHKQAFYQADGGTENGLAVLKHNINCISGFSGSSPVLGGDIKIDAGSENLWTNSSTITPTVSNTSRDFYYSSANGQSLTPPYTNGIINNLPDPALGSNLPQLGGYEGLAKSNSYGMGRIYEIKVSHTGLRNSQSNVCIVYRADSQFGSNPAGNCVY